MLEPNGLHWERLESELDGRGYALIDSALDPSACAALATLFDCPEAFRKTVEMSRHHFGRGTYRYFKDPLPEPVAELRQRLYSPLACIANRWQERLAKTSDYPATLDGFHHRCRQQGQALPTCLVLDYGPGGYNCLHQDRYGEVAFPLQATVLLSEESGFRGGEFMLVEQRPRKQSRATAVTLYQGQLIVFPNAARPVQGARGYYRVQTRHGVSEVLRGRRRTLGLIFHLAST